MAALAASCDRFRLPGEGSVPFVAGRAALAMGKGPGAVLLLIRVAELRVTASITAASFPSPQVTNSNGGIWMDEVRDTAVMESSVFQGAYVRACVCICVCVHMCQAQGKNHAGRACVDGADFHMSAAIPVYLHTT